MKTRSTTSRSTLPGPGHDKMPRSQPAGIIAQKLLDARMQRDIERRLARVAEHLSDAAEVGARPRDLVLACHHRLAHVDHKLLVERFAAIDRPAAEVEAGIVASQVRIVASPERDLA